MPAASQCTRAPLLFFLLLAAFARQTAAFALSSRPMHQAHLLPHQYTFTGNTETSDTKSSRIDPPPPLKIPLLRNVSLQARDSALGRKSVRPLRPSVSPRMSFTDDRALQNQIPIPRKPDPALPNRKLWKTSTTMNPRRHTRPEAAAPKPPRPPENPSKT